MLGPNVESLVNETISLKSEMRNVQGTSNPNKRPRYEIGDNSMIIDSMPNTADIATAFKTVLSKIEKIEGKLEKLAGEKQVNIVEQVSSIRGRNISRPKEQSKAKREPPLKKKTQSDISKLYPTTLIMAVRNVLSNDYTCQDTNIVS